ncbi:MAG: histidine kinase dimerization/phospho-acceptor domain-containing protein [Gammaproteobacteria bacterium]
MTALRDAQDVIIPKRKHITEAEAERLALSERLALAAAVGKIAAEEMRLKDEFLSHVSHELRSPLTAITQFTEILLDARIGPLNAEQSECR